jgi:hypothetical protein
MEMNNDIQGKVSADQEQLRNERNAIEAKISADMSAIKTDRAELEQKITETLDKQLKGVIMMVEQRVHERREEFNNELQATRSHVRSLVERARKLLWPIKWNYPEISLEE